MLIFLIRIFDLISYFFRKFGTSKRLCEGDKKEIQELLALKLQVSQDEWQKDFDLLKVIFII